jgi:hypothetical protein
MKERLKVGPAKFCRGGTVKFGRYENGVIAIQILGPEGPEAKATVNMPMEPTDPKTGVWIKDWSENEGMAEALVKAGVVVLTGETQRNGHVIARLGVLTPAALVQLQEEAP